MFLTLLASTLHKGGAYFGMNANIGLLHRGVYKTPTLIGITVARGNALARVRQNLHDPHWRNHNGNEDRSVQQDLDNMNFLSSKILEKNSSHSTEFDWSLGMYLGYRWILPKQWFLDWTYLDFSQGFSLCSFRTGRYLSERWSVFGTLTPCLLMTDGWIASLKAMTSSPKFDEYENGEHAQNTDVLKAVEALRYRIPIIALGGALGLGATYRLSPRTSFIMQYTLQMSYFSEAALLGEVGISMVKNYLLEQIEDPLEKAATKGGMKIYSGILSSLGNPLHIRHRISVGIEFHRVAY